MGRALPLSHQPQIFSLIIIFCVPPAHLVGSGRLKQSQEQGPYTHCQRSYPSSSIVLQCQSPLPPILCPGSVSDHYEQYDRSYTSYWRQREPPSPDLPDSFELCRLQLQRKNDGRAHPHLHESVRPIAVSRNVELESRTWKILSPALPSCQTEKPSYSRVDWNV